MQRLAHPHVAFDVFDHHGTVVDEDADCEGKSTERHGIQGLPGQLDEQHRGDDGQRDGGEDDDGQPHVAQKQDDDQCRQPCRHAGAQQHAVQRRPDEYGLIEQSLHRDVFGEHGLDVGQRSAHPVDHCERRNTASFSDGHEGARRSIDRHGIGLHLKPVVDMRHIAHEHHPPVDLLDRESVDRFDHVRRIVHCERVILVTDLDVAGGQYDVLSLEGAAHIGCRQASRGQSRQIQIRHDHAGLAAIGVGNFGAMHDCEGRSYDVLPKIVELGVGQRLAREAQLDDGYVRRPVPEDQGRSDVGRHVFEDHQRAARQLRHGPGHIRTLVKIDLLDTDALIADGFDAGDIVDQRRQLPLVQRQDAVLNVLRAHAVVGPHHGHDRDVDLRKDVDRHSQCRANSHQGDQNQRGDNRIGSPQGSFNDGHGHSL